MNLPPDHAQRQRALHPGQSFIVQAPAGSGKTELLVRRYLALLAKVDAPEQILAITFTKKATAEMRLRICNALRRVRENGAPGGDASESSREILALVDAALANDDKHGWDITANTRRLRIQTIDAFCNELVRRMPWSARFGSPPDIVDDPDPLYLQAAKHTLDHLDDRNSDHSDACQHLLELVDADWNKAHALLADMLAKRDKWMPMLGPAGRAHHEGMWRQVIEMELRRVARLIPEGLQTELAELGAFAAGNLKASGRASAILALQGAQGFPGSDYRHIEQWHGISDLLLTGKGGLRKTVNVNQGFPVDTKHNQAMKARMLGLLEGFIGLPESETEADALIEGLIKVRLLPGAGFSDAQWRSINALMQLLPVASAELRILFTAQNQADYIELSQRAAMALGDPDNPSDLALAFDYRLGHLLMDEFQDTSSAHVDLLTKLTAGWQNGDGRTLFLVGDPMQSIYRFREAEVANFLQVQQTGLGDILPESIVLMSNFRSAPALVAWFNRTFRVVLPDQDDMVNGAVSYAPAAAHTTNPKGEVRLHPVINGAPGREGESIAALVKQAQKQDPDQSIAVLGRARTHLHDIAAALRRQGVSFQAVDLEKLNDRPAIRDLIAITRALAQPADRIAWLTLLRAPWCGLSLGDISALAGDDHAATIIELWQNADLVAALSAEGRARLKRLADSLAAALHGCGRMGLRQNVEAAWLRLGGPATIEPSDVDDCHRYLDLLDDMESNRVDISADNLKKATKDLWARGDADARVQLLTIHKAKGLEFDTVFLPGLDRRPRSAEKTLLRWRKFPKQLLMAPLPSSTNKNDPFYKYLEYLETIHAHNELGRLLYVACTRARKNLHLFGSVGEKDGEVRKPASSSLLSLLWPLVGDAYADAVCANGVDAADESATSAFRPRPVQRLPGEWLPPVLPQSIVVKAAVAGATDETASIEFSWAGETARIAGIVIHQILQRVDGAGWARWSRPATHEKQKPRWRNQLMENGIYGRHLETALERVVEAIDNTRSDPKAAWIFSAEHQDIKSEWPLSGRVDGKIVHIVIDRSFTDENGIRWIVDFKSGRHQGADPDGFLDQEQKRHQQQMSLYAAVVGQLQAGEIKLGLYFPALQGWREWAG